ncbi:MAG: hypothetical protein CM1200mP41_12970 [Gammaproteobacteria bacterium]|nr:MAG: hypothetical protein CM1200mP41_12970 [Gammaproteobacteria bacterium]
MRYVDAFNVGSKVRIVVSAELGYPKVGLPGGGTFTLDVFMPVESESEDGSMSLVIRENTSGWTFKASRSVVPWIFCSASLVRISSSVQMLVVT